MAEVEGAAAGAAPCLGSASFEPGALLAIRPKVSDHRCIRAISPMRAWLGAWAHTMEK